MSFTLLALKAEINTDPLALGYKVAGVWKPGQEIADLLNAKNYTIDAISIGMEDARAATTSSAYGGLTADKKEYLRWITPNGGQLRISADVKLQLTGRALCVAGSPGTGNDNSSWWIAQDRAPMSAAFRALIELPGSRAEVLWGQDMHITALLVAQAFNAT